MACRPSEIKRLAILSLISRVHHRPDPETLESLTQEFSDLLVQGAIEAGESLSEEGGGVPDLARVTLYFERREVGRLRRLIDRLKQLADPSPPPREARRREIIETHRFADREEAELE